MTTEFYKKYRAAEKNYREHQRKLHSETAAFGKTATEAWCEVIRKYFKYEEEIIVPAMTEFIIKFIHSQLDNAQNRNSKPDLEYSIFNFTTCGTGEESLANIVTRHYNNFVNEYYGYFEETGHEARCCGDTNREGLLTAYGLKKLSKQLKKHKIYLTKESWYSKYVRLLFPLSHLKKFKPYDEQCPEIKTYRSFKVHLLPKWKRILYNITS